uniref:Uncharacterized protein n=1 Tax=Calidris pygmaea TaxID=425635 RepID=A0A8C3KE92_9CHAR
MQGPGSTGLGCIPQRGASPHVPIPPGGPFSPPQMPQQQHPALPPCSRVTLQPCHPAALTPCRRVTPQPCQPATLQTCHPAVLTSCSPVTLQLFHSAALPP